MMMLINPGTGPVDDATEEQARTNMQEFLAELALGEDVTAERNNYADNGRFGFTVKLGAKSCAVDMPGVAGLSEAAQKAQIHPRLYVDGNSWYWDFALRQVRHALTRNATEDE